MIQGKPAPKPGSVKSMFPGEPDPEIPEEDDYSKEAAKTYHWGDWRSRAEDYPWLYKSGDPPRPVHPMRDDWGYRRMPVDYKSDWAKVPERYPWEVYMDAYAGWRRERDRLVEVYKRKVEQIADYEESVAVYEGKFPYSPEYPEAQHKVFDHATSGEIVELAGALEDPLTDVNAKDTELMTPLMYAALDGSLECVEYLVDMGADVTILSGCNDTAFDIAVHTFVKKNPRHPLILFFQALNAPRGTGWKSKLKIPVVTDSDDSDESDTEYYSPHYPPPSEYKRGPTMGDEKWDGHVLKMVNPNDQK